MTTPQSRGIPQYTPSQAQPIPISRYQTPQFSQGPAFSPRHNIPSSSPHQQSQYYQQPGIGGGTHDMYKGPGVGVAGTPPAQNMMMPTQQPYFNGGHRQRTPMQTQRAYYYNPQQVVQRFPGMPGPPSSVSPYQSYPAQPQYHQYMPHPPPMAQQQMYGGPSGYPPQYTQQQQLQPQQITPIQVQSMMSQQQPGSSQKREKRIITIKDPNTNIDITDEIIKGQRHGSQSTPPSGRSSATPPAVDVGAIFAAKVALAAGSTKSASPLATPPIDTHPMMVSQNTSMMHQMQPDQQIVGSPSMSVTMGPPNTAFMGVHPGSAPSPRPQNMLPQVQQQMMMMPPTGMQPPLPMLPPSPSHATPPPQMLHGQMGMQPQGHEPMQQTTYQLPSQQAQSFGTSPMSSHMPSRPIPTNIPENVHAYPAHSPQVNIASGDKAMPSQPTQTPTVRPMIRPPIQIQQQQHHQAAVNPVQTVKAPVPKDYTHTDNVPVQSQQPANVPVATTPVAQKEQEIVQPTTASAAAAQDEGGITETQPTEQIGSSAQGDGATAVEKAAVSSETVTDGAPVVESSVNLSKTVPEKQEIPVDTKSDEPVPSEPEKTEQAPEKEDTAIRLGDETKSASEAPEDKSLLDEGAEATKAVESEDTKAVETSPSAQKELPEKDISALVVEATKPVKPMTEVTPSTTIPKPEPVKQVSAPSVSIVPPTPPSKPAPPESTEEKVPVPSAKAAVKKPDVQPELPPAQIQTKVARVAEKQPSKSRVKSPEPTKSEVKPGKQTRKDSTSSDRQQKSSVSKTPSSQKLADKPVVNGLTSSTESESSKTTKKTEDVPSAKAKTTENKPTTETKPQSKDVPTRTPSVSSEKSSTEKSTDSEKTNGVTSGKAKGALEIKYEDDQWSPLNPDGKRKYDSNFLLQFQYRPTSLEKPKDLPNIDIVLEQPHKKIATPMQPMEMRGMSDFTPAYMSRGPGPRRPGRQNSRDHRMGGGRSSMSGQGPKIIQKVVSIDRDVELKTVENAWKPSRRDKTLTQKPQDEVETMEIMRDVRAILNKLTPSTFTTLMQQVLALKIDTEKKLRGTIDLIFEKAIDEPNFSEAYANMCRQMTAIRVTPEEPPAGSEQPTPTQPVEFRKLLLTKCQREFEKNKMDQEHLQELRKKMEENTDTEIAPQLKEEYELAETKERRRSLGNIRFIGELFKLRMLTESIMHNCIMSLFKARDDDHLESLCRLLTTIGKDLDHQKGKQRMDQYFEQVRKIIQEKRTSSRVRFMLQDVTDLRLNNWVPRAISVQGPKTINQIHQDAKEEQELLQLKLATTTAPTPMKHGGRQNRMGSRGHGEDGWTKVQTPAKPTRYDPNKMKLKPNQFDETKVTLGPSRGIMSWKSGSASASSGLSKTGSGGYSPSGSMDRTPETGRSNTPTNMMNRFSALSQGQSPDYDYQRRQGGRQSSREGTRSGSRGSMGPPSSSSSGGRTPRKDERASALEATRKLTSAERSYDSRQKSSRESSPSVKPRPSTPQQQQPQPTAHKYNTDLDEEKMQQKSKNILQEFLSIVDFKEATECIEELNAPPSLMHSLVYIAHEFTLEKKSLERTNIGRFMAHLLKRGRLSVEQYMKGLAELLELGTDFEIDVPKIWEYFAEQLSPVFEDENESDMPLTCLAELAAPLQEEDRSGRFVAEIVKAIVKRVTLEAFVPRWQRSNLLWSDIIGKKDDSVEKFLAEHNLSELSDLKGPPREQSAAVRPAQSSAADEQYRLEQDITKLLEDNLSNEDIFVWVDKNVQRPDIVKPPFLRALTISVCKKAMDLKVMNVIEDRISERGIVLKKYIDTDPERELQALYALQHLMVILEQPANVLRKFFDVLYNEDVVSEQTFYKWEKSDDPNEQEGRGVAVTSVNPFFTWLRTAEPESD